MLSPAANAITDYAVLAGTVEIGASAFANNKTVTRVVLPEGVTTIGDEAFAGCAALTELVIPNSSRHRRARGQLPGDGRVRHEGALDPHGGQLGADASSHRRARW